ncbi:glycoside hydrolase family 128 protein [Trametes coccinea BRFM310]|uniref:Glycoside hydrolase family 128 protein n=1 Tax=Trametes coccinea (strain BRFM310) TaxID=1353009 RepID=A0A1Y2ICI6_TRAC3|nr:glycoside hydrolase family 128 protein [Trametes coccinea BRFM310]
MKFAAASLVSIALLLASSAQGAQHMQKKHHRRTGPSATFSQPAPTTTAAAPAPTSTSTGSGTIKRGLSFNDASLTKDFTSKQVSWAYNWDSSFSGSLPDGVVYFPMLWSADPSHSAQWADNANAAIAKGSTHLLFINEPDLSSQSNTSPQDAAQQWMQFMQPFAGKANLVSPAITNGAPPMGTGWMDEFLAECEKLGCQVDSIAAHIYDSATNVAYYQSYITDLGTRYNRSVLITEFGASGTVEQQQAFLQQMVPFLDNLDSVSHYAWFMTAVGNLVNSDASLSSLGETYVSS